MPKKSLWPTAGLAGLAVLLPPVTSAARDHTPGVAAVVDRQLAAYNAGDIDAFVQTYAPCAEVFRLLEDTGPSLRGREAIRAAYGPRFARFPGPHADIVRRTVAGDFVTDHEALPRTGQQAIVTYEVRDGAIRRAWIVGPFERPRRPPRGR